MLKKNFFGGPYWEPKKVRSQKRTFWEKNRQKSGN